VPKIHIISFLDVSLQSSGCCCHL